MKKLVLLPVLFVALTAMPRACPAGESGVASTRVLLFAASENDEDAALRRDSLATLRHRLTAGSISDADITLVHANAAEADQSLREGLRTVSGAAGFNDSVLIYVAASPSDSRSGRVRIGNRDWQLQELINAMFSSASSKRCLFVDTGTAGTGDSNGINSNGLILPDNLWVAFSRSSRRETSNSGKAITAFSSAVGNALSGCADTPGASGGDGVLTLLEITEYLRNYAETFDFPAPGITGKISGGQPLLRASRSDALRSVSDNVRQMIVRNAIESAGVLLFHEQSPSKALAVLGDAQRIAERRDQAVRLLQTAQAATGRTQQQKLLAAIKAAISNQGSIRLQAGKTVKLYSPGKATKTLLPESDDILVATAVKEEPQRVWVWIKAVYRGSSTRDDDTVDTRFNEVPELQGRWAMLHELASSSNN